MAPGTKWLRGKKNQGTNAKRRRQGALERLKMRLKKDNIELTEAKIIKNAESWMQRLLSSIKRQEKEIAILEERV